MENQKRIENPNAWLDIANHDLQGSRLCSENKMFDTSVFCAHDSVEKSLKAFLVLNKMEGDKFTHDLKKLTNQCVRFDNSFKTLLPFVETINGWSVVPGLGGLMIVVLFSTFFSSFAGGLTTVVFFSTTAGGTFTRATAAHSPSKAASHSRACRLLPPLKKALARRTNFLKSARRDFSDAGFGAI